nr:ArdC family protein [Azospirillum lipoferum]
MDDRGGKLVAGIRDRRHRRNVPSPLGRRQGWRDNALPRNAVSGRRYSGINVLILWSAMAERGFSGHGRRSISKAAGITMCS